MKKVVIIGGGASGLLTSIIIKKELQDLVDVVVVENGRIIGKSSGTAVVTVTTTL